MSENLPQAPDAEMAVLCCIMLNPDQLLTQANADGVTPELFYNAANKRLFEIITELKTGDTTILTEYIRDKKDPALTVADLGDIYLTEHSETNWQSYVDILKDRHNRRDGIQKVQALVSHETNALPHALGPEKSVLSFLLNEPERLTENHGITADTFYLPAHKTIFSHLARIHERGDTVEMIGFVQSLIDSGELDNVGGPAAITEIFSYPSVSSHFAQHLREIHDKHAQRLFVLAGYAAQAGDENQFHQLIAQRDKVRELASNQDTLLDRLESLRYDPDTPPPPDEVCLTLLDQPVAARGNLTVIQAKQKAGKTGVITSDLAAAIRGSYQAQGDMLGFAWRGDATGAILHLDTEQSRADHHSCVERARKRAGIAAADRLHSYSIVTFKISERMEVLRRKMKQLASKSKVDCVIVDGLADLLPDVNNNEQANDLVAELMRMAQEYDCAIIGVIHENPGTDAGKTRGHLGSELQRKAYANIRIDKDPETNVSTIYGPDFRHGSIPKNQGLCFAWDNEQGMHVTLGIHSQIVGQAKENAKATKEREKWKEIFDHATDENGTKCVCPELSPAQAAKIIQDMNGTKEPPKPDTIKHQMQRAETHGVLRKSGRGTWTMNQSGQTGQKRDNEEMS
jgi:hypothetical protein